MNPSDSTRRTSIMKQSFANSRAKEMHPMQSRHLDQSFKRRYVVEEESDSEDIVQRNYQSQPSPKHRPQLSSQPATRIRTGKHTIPASKPAPQSGIDTNLSQEIIQENLKAAVDNFALNSSKSRRTKKPQTQPWLDGFGKQADMHQVEEIPIKVPVVPPGKPSQLKGFNMTDSSQKLSTVKSPVRITKSESFELQAFKAPSGTRLSWKYQTERHSVQYSALDMPYRRQRYVESDSEDEFEEKIESEPILENLESPPVKKLKWRPRPAKVSDRLDDFPLDVARLFADSRKKKTKRPNVRPYHPYSRDKVDASTTTVKTKKKRRFEANGGYRGRAPKPVPPRITLMDLAPELRNEIYAYLIPQSRVLIQTSQPNIEHARMKAQIERLWIDPPGRIVRPRKRLYHTLDNDQIRKGLSLTQSLMLVNKQIRTDIEMFLYARTTFCYSSHNVLSKFLEQASQVGIRAIEKVEIYQHGYGNPECTAFQTYTDKYYRKWQKTCASIGEKLMSLRSIKLDAVIFTWPFQFAAIQDSDWWKSCQLMVPHEKLPLAQVLVKHRMVAENKSLLEHVSRQLENTLMNEAGQKSRNQGAEDRIFAQKLAKAEAGEEKKRLQQVKERAPKELVITMNDVQCWKASNPAKKGKQDDYVKKAS